MKAHTAKSKQTRHPGSTDRSRRGQADLTTSVADSRPEMQQQQGLLSLMSGSPRLQRTCACGAPSAAGGSCATCEVKATDASSKVLQKKLAIGAAEDPLEREADRVADQVMRMEPLSLNGLVPAPLGIQRLGAHSGTNPSMVPPPSVERVLAGSGRPLEPGLREDMELRFGYDLSNVRVHTGEDAAGSASDVRAKAYTVGSHIVFGAGQFAPHTRLGYRLLAHELAHTVQQGSEGTLRRQLSGTAKQTESKRYVIHIPAGITTQQQFLRYAEVQIFGRVLNIEWISREPKLDEPAKHIGQPINVDVATSLLERFGSSERAGDTKVEKAEAEKTYKGLENDARKAIDVEIDHRYHESTKETPGTRIKPGEAGKVIIWNSLKQQVLADKHKVEQLPETIKSLLGESNLTPENYQILIQLGETLSQLSDAEIKAFFVAGPNGGFITPADYPQLLSISRKLAALPPGARKDYLSRINASTSSLSQMETSIDNFIQFRVEREKEVEKHETAAKPLLGAEDVYTAYRNYKKLENTPYVPSSLDLPDRVKEREASYKGQLHEAETKLLGLLKHKDFASIAAFETAIESYRVVFRTQAIDLALDVLARYEHMLFEERNRLKQQGTAAAIVKGISDSKASSLYTESSDKRAKARKLRHKGMTHEMWVQAKQLDQEAEEAKVRAESDVIKGSGDNPLVKEHGIDLEKLAGADEAGVQSYLTEQINKREADVKSTREEFKTDPDRVFKLPDLVAATYKLLGTESTTVYGRIISDYITDEAGKHLLSSIAVGILAIALTFLVPGGGWLTAAALVAQASLSTYQAFQAYKEYQEQERDYELGFLAEEPSLFWVGVAIAGAALDIGVASIVLLKQSASALKALKGPMLQFAKDGDVPTLLAKIEAAEGLDTKVRSALARELKASEAAKASFKEVLTIGSRVGGFAGMVDPGLVKHFFHALYYSIKRGVNTIVKLSADAKFLEIASDITKMSGTERAQLEAALEEVKNLVKVGGAKGMDESSLVNFVDRWALNRNTPGFQTKLLDEMNAWKPLTAEQKKALDALEVQRGIVKTLQEQKGAALEELKTLRAKPDKTADDIAEIKTLAEELRVLDPKAPPDKKPAAGIGKIAEAERKLEEVEKEAAKAQLSLYDRMRNAKPSAAARESALKKPSVEDIASPLKTKPTPKQVDHIVSVREISDMDGFADLPLKDQREIVNTQENLIAMDASANGSKSDWPWKSWPQAAKFYDKATIDAMVLREAEVRTLIQAEIKTRIEELAVKP